MAKKKRPNSPAAMLRVAEALKLIEEAQNTLDRACQQLSSLRFGAKHYSAVSRLSLKVRNAWYALDAFAEVDQSLTVDSEPEVYDPPGEIK